MTPESLIRAAHARAHQHDPLAVKDSDFFCDYFQHLVAPTTSDGRGMEPGVALAMTLEYLRATMLNRRAVPEIVIRPDDSEPKDGWQG